MLSDWFVKVSAPEGDIGDWFKRKTLRMLLVIPPPRIRATAPATPSPSSSCIPDFSLEKAETLCSVVPQEQKGNRGEGRKTEERIERA